MKFRNCLPGLEQMRVMTTVCQRPLVGMHYILCCSLVADIWILEVFKSYLQLQSNNILKLAWIYFIWSQLRLTVFQFCLLFFLIKGSNFINLEGENIYKLLWPQNRQYTAALVIPGKSYSYIYSNSKAWSFLYYLSGWWSVHKYNLLQKTITWKNLTQRYVLVMNMSIVMERSDSDLEIPMSLQIKEY